MATTAMFAEIAALAGDQARAAMLHALMDGRALTASELARSAGITPQTASGHLGRMTAVGLLRVEKQGRHRYHRLASPAVARMMEGIMLVASGRDAASARISVGPRDAVLRSARTCYDHLAGRLGVALADALVAGGYAQLDSDAGAMTATGMELFARLGLNIDALRTNRGGRPGRVLCRPCLDWSERRLHLAGAVGAALCRHGFEQAWIRRIEGIRAVSVTPKGERVLREQLGVRLD